MFEISLIKIIVFELEVGKVKGELWNFENKLGEVTFGITKIS